LTCFESIEGPNLKQVIRETDEGFKFDDGGCCELNNKAVCCIIRLNKAVALKGIITTLSGLIVTAVILGLRVGR